MGRTAGHPRSDDDELSKRPAKRPRDGETPARRGSTGESTALLPPLEITQACLPDQTDHSPIPLRRRRYYRERPPTDLGATEPYLLWQRALGEPQPLPSWSWSVTYVHDAPWIPRRAPSTPRPRPSDDPDPEPPEEAAASPKLRRRRTKFVPDPSLVPRRSSRVLTRATSTLAGSASPAAVARILPSLGSTRSSARISSQSLSSTGSVINEKEADARMEPVAEGSEVEENADDELDVAVAVAEPEPARGPSTSENEEESVALSLISLSVFRQGGQAEHSPIERVVEPGAYFPSPSPPLIISRRPFALPQKPVSLEPYTRLILPCPTSLPPRPRSAVSSSRFKRSTTPDGESPPSALERTSLHFDINECQKLRSRSRRRTRAPKPPRKKRPSGSSQAKAHRPWTTSNDNGRSVYRKPSPWSPIKFDMFAQRRTIKDLQDLLFRGGEDAIDPYVLRSPMPSDSPDS